MKPGSPPESNKWHSTVLYCVGKLVHQSPRDPLTPYRLGVENFLGEKQNSQVLQTLLLWIVMRKRGKRRVKSFPPIPFKCCFPKEWSGRKSKGQKLELYQVSLEEIMQEYKGHWCHLKVGIPGTLSV